MGKKKKVGRLPNYIIIIEWQVKKSIEEYVFEYVYSTWFVIFIIPHYQDMQKDP